MFERLNTINIPTSCAPLAFERPRVPRNAHSGPREPINSLRSSYHPIVPKRCKRDLFMGGPHKRGKKVFNQRAILGFVMYWWPPVTNMIHDNFATFLRPSQGK